MTTGHAPDDWLDIPPPPFAPDGDPAEEDPAAEGNGNSDGAAAAAEAQAAAVGELPTGELQVIDVPDADAEDAARTPAGGEAPTGEIPAVETSAAEAGTAGTTMTGQFRAVAAALAADVTATRAADLAGASGNAPSTSPTAGDHDSIGAGATAAPTGDDAEPGPGAAVADAANGELPATDTPGPGLGDEPTDVAPDTSGAGVGEEPTGELPAVGSPDSATEAGSGGVTMTGQFRAVAAALAADVTATRAADLAGAAADATRANDRATAHETGLHQAAGQVAAPGDAGARPTDLPDEGGAVRVDEGGAAPGDAEERPAGRAGEGIVGSAGRVREEAGGPEAGATIDGDGGDGAAGARGAVDEIEGDDGVDVAGAADVPESPPAAKAWRVPVLRSERDPAVPPPPDALPAADVEVDDLGPRARRRIEARRHRTVKLRRQRRLAVAGLALLLASGATLGVVGLGKVRGSNGGRYVDPQVRPDEPGYVALVTPTPTLLVVHKDAAGALSGVSLLSLHAQDEGGSVIVMPVTTVAPFAEPGTTFADAYAERGAEGVATQVQLILNVTIGETVEVDDARWATLVGPVAPLAVELERAVGDWPAGAAEIPADQVGAFLTARTDSETELGRLDRQELFWQTWLPLVKAGGRNAVPGEVDVGLGRFVRGLAAGDTDVAGLPVSAAFSAEEMYAPTEEMLPDLVAHAVPYPQEPSRGSRVQTQLLNGTTQRDLTARAATSLVAGGAEIALVGNATSFAEPTTRFIYANSKLRDDAQKLRDAFGVGEVVQAPSRDDAPPVEEDRIDVTVILGADALDALGG